MESLGRDSLREGVLRKYDLLKTDRTTAKPIIVYRGIPGIGKTNLLRDHLNDVDSTKGYGMYVNGKELLRRAEQTDGDVVRGSSVLFLREIAAGIDPRLIDPGYHDRINEIAAEDSVDIHTGFVMTAAKLSAISQLRPVFLGFDDWDGAPSSKFKDIHHHIEKELMLPIAVDTQANIVTAMATRHEVRFRETKVRQLAYEVFLAPLKLEDHWLMAGGTGDRLVYSLTQGIPRLGQYLVDTYGQQYVNSEEMIKQGSKIARELAEVLADPIIELRDPETRAIFEFASQFREFDLHLLRSLLPKVDSAYKDSSQARYLEALRKFCQTGVVRWSSDLRSYEIEPHARRVFANDLRFNDPEKYRALHDLAADYYKDLLKDVPSMRKIYALEYVFHRAKSAPMTYSVRPYVETVLPYIGADYEQLHAFRYALAHDHEIFDIFQGI